MEHPLRVGLGSGIRSCLIIQHVAPERPFAVDAALARRDVATDLRAVFDGEALPPDLSGHDGLVVMGGPMSAFDDAGFPTRRSELALLGEAVERGLPTLGICLGAQLLALATGGAVVPGGAGPEVGWLPVQLSARAADDPLFGGLASTATVLHWHGDTYRPGPSAVRLASSARYSEQAFRVGRAAWGLQFHVEVDELAVRGFAEAFADEAAAAPGGVLALLAESAGAVEALQPVRDCILDRFAALVAASPEQVLETSDLRQEAVTEP